MNAEAVLARLAQERTLYDALLTRALRLARSTLEELPAAQTFHVEGASSLLGSTERQDVSLATLRAPPSASGRIEAIIVRGDPRLPARLIERSFAHAGIGPQRPG